MNPRKAFNEENESLLKEEFETLPGRYSSINKVLYVLSEKLRSDKSKEYLFHGVLRRLGIMRRCTHNILKIFPVYRIEKLKSDELHDVDINMQSFIFNVYGVFDNLAWIFVHEKGLDLKKEDVGLFQKETQKYILSEDFKKYLNVEVKPWFFQYLSDYRHALGHRIPLYVPPMFLTNDEAIRFKEIDSEKFIALAKKDFDTLEKLIEEEENIGQVMPYFAHSHSENNNPQVLHAHLISDLRTIEEIINRFPAIFE